MPAARALRARWRLALSLGEAAPAVMILAAGCRGEPAPTAPADAPGPALPAAAAPSAHAVASAEHRDERPHGAAGEWCGAAREAWAVAIANSPAQRGCPKFVDGARLAPDAGRGGGLATFPVDAFGYYDDIGTSRTRASRPGACCYNWREKRRGGRPLVDGALAWTAPARRGTEWIASAVAPAPVPARVARRRARRWLAEALAEHASVASFARAALELLALGAPAPLVAACHAAALDEIAHARACFALASAYAGARLGPGPLAPLAARHLDLPSLAVATFEEACLGESVAALGAARAARRSRDPALRGICERIAEDEARHAELAWAIVGWALRQGGTGVARALTTAARRRRAAGAVARGLQRNLVREVKYRFAAVTRRR